MSEFIKEQILEATNSVLKLGNKKYLNFGVTKECFKLNNKNYCLLNFKNILYSSIQEKEYFIKLLSKQIKLYSKNVSKVLIVGLGNRHISADSLGAECLKSIISTRSLFKTKVEVSAISTGVLGLTGIESADFINSIKNVVKPNLIILIDTLCANDYKNLGVNFQICESGLTPGEGIGNHRKKVSESNLKSKIISIGVPLVVYAKNFVENAIEYAAKDLDKFSLMDCNKLLEHNFDNMVVASKDIDIWVKLCGKLIGFAINMALNGYSIEEQKNILQLI